MDMTYEQWRQVRKQIQRQMSVSGWALLIYYGIVNVSVMVFLFAQVMGKLIQGLIFEDYGSITDAVMQAAESAWGYFFAAAVGLLLLLIWKKPRFFKEEIFATGAPMKAWDFFTILCIFIGGQTVFQFVTMLLELFLNLFGYTIAEGLESLQSDPDNFSMFLYAGILAPVAEELLFRGLVQRTMLPFGKKLAILASSLTFGLYHGNLIQTPYAFVVGLVLGYVAAEYNILWAMVLHMINNLLLGDLLYRLLAGLPQDTVDMIVWEIILAFSVAAVILMVVRRKEIAAWMRREPIARVYAGCYFSSPGTIALLIVLGATTLFTTWSMIVPL